MRRGPPPPEEVLISPDGSRALVRANNHVYMITVPPIAGEEAPAVSVNPASAVPTWRLTRVGGDFIGWMKDVQVTTRSAEASFATRWRWRIPCGRLGVQARERARPGAPKPDSAETARRAKETRAYEATRVDVEIRMPKDKPRGTVVLRGARVITMKGDEVIESGDVVVRDNRIAAVGSRGSVPIPPDARIVDVSGKTILPGYVDIHAHTWVAWGVHRGQVSQFMAQLAYGVTTQRDPQTSTEDVLSYTDLMETGDLIGPRLYSTGPGSFLGQHQEPGGGAGCAAALCRPLQHPDHQAVPRRGPVRQWGSWRRGSSGSPRPPRAAAISP